MTLTKEQLSELVKLAKYNPVKHGLHHFDKVEIKSEIVVELVEGFLGLQEALQNIAEPDYNDIDGMIITDMGLKHFTEKTAEFALEKYGAK